ncbi:MAG: radical SAM family heme chaperone HemW [Chloroflexi bacterium]|jgi:oxygen-independent coproporphyrinogen-3 oxidase|nr:radical SAM family heme chaperone HemW [Chloroflexota bacterium]MBT5627192.1 radical SAM family heme chaperone HemW [Chloroflexota bacterium]
MPNLAEIKHSPPTYDGGIGLYLHVPFCQTKCPYCDFNTYAGIEDQISGYVRSLQDELIGWANVLGHPPVRTIFLGGGTPSYLPPADLEAIHQTIRDAFRVEDSAEITMECNPGDVTAEKAASWLASGVNRISMGVQSFDDELLGLLGRRHTAAEAKEAFKTLRKAGFVNQSIDLIYGLPYQSAKQWSDTLDKTIDLEPEHISLYSLQIEQGTPLAVDVEAGKYPIPDDDLAADMYEEAQTRLGENGFSQYEISNWSKPDMESRHNIIYWLNEPYLGVGPGAHSWLAGQRFANLRSPRRYTTIVGTDYENGAADPVSAMTSPAGPVEMVDITTPAIDVAETMMMGMRLNQGVTHERFEKRFGAAVDVIFPDEVARLTKLGLIDITKEAVLLSERGRLLGNEVFAEFIGDPDE